MSKKYRVFLNGKKRSNLKRLINTGTEKAKKLTRARILLLADEKSIRSVKDGQRDNRSIRVSGLYGRYIGLI